MSASSIFTIIIELILLRVIWLKIKAASTRNESFKQLPLKDQLAVLKECLLNNPTEINLQNLKDFAQRASLDLEVESYRPFMKRQLELSKAQNALAEDNELFAEEARWLDQIQPLEFAEGQAALQLGDLERFIKCSLEGIAQLYSDQAITDHLETLLPHYPKAASLLEEYRKLVELRESSGADEESLAKLRKAKECWENNLLSIQE
ncbi:MAG: hypothetical protein MJZ26_10870 [Fibrobacter sp.]|nr:hypothetical protein [Fibrobacter sp.]